MEDDDEFGALYGDAQDAPKPQGTQALHRTMRISCQPACTAPKVEPSPGAIPTAPAGTDEALFGQVWRLLRTMAHYYTLRTTTALW